MPQAHENRRAVGLRLFVLARQLRNHFDRRVNTLQSITRSQWSVIVTVKRNPGATQRMIADALEMSEASAGRLIDRLCSEGYLERRQRSDDKRARAIYITEKAAPVLSQLAEVSTLCEESAFSGFSEAETTQLLSFIDRIYTNIAQDKA